MNCLIVGASGFIGNNAASFFAGIHDILVFHATRETGDSELKRWVSQADVILHLAGSNRPIKESEFKEINVGLTKKICTYINVLNVKPLLIFASSTQAELSNPYGVSKKLAEEEIVDCARKNKLTALIYRLPNVFGKGCRPNYNSVVATFCFNIANNLPIRIDNPGAVLNLIYVDDVIKNFHCQILKKHVEGVSWVSVEPIHKITVSELADCILSLKNNEKIYMNEAFEINFLEALRLTYLSHISKNKVGSIK